MTTSCERDTKRQRRLDDQLLQAACGGDVIACRRAWAGITNQKSYQTLWGIYEGPSPRWDMGNSKSPLHMAVYHGHTDIVRLLIQEFEFPVNQTDYVETPLGVACHRGHVEICRMLLGELGADPELGGGVHGDCDSGAICPLWAAARNGNTEIVKLLIQHGARIDFNSLDTLKTHREYDEYEWAYPSEIAIQTSNIDMLKVFIDHGANFPSKENPLTGLDFQDCTDAMMEFLVSLLNGGNHAAIIEYLVAIIGDLFTRVLEHGASTYPSDASSTQLNCFFNAGLHYDVLTKQLRDAAHCESPIHSTMESGNHIFCEKLLRAGANVNEKDENGRTPLALAASNDHLEICRVLLSNGAIVDDPDNTGWTALQLTLYFCGDYLRMNTIDICETLLSAGADFLLQKGESRSAFELSVSFDDVRLLDRFLVVWDSRFDQDNHGRNNDGDLPIHVAVTNPRISLSVLHALFNHNSKALSVPDGESGWLPLYLACMWGAELDVIFLILREYPSAVDPRTVLELLKDASD